MTKPSTSADRMRRARERKRAGSNIVSFEVGHDAAAALERLGWISEGSCSDQKAISAGIVTLCEQALSQGLRPGVTGHDDDLDEDYELIDFDP